MDLGVGVVEHPVRWSYVAGTKVTIATPIRMLADIAALRFQRRFEPAVIRCRYETQLLEHAAPLSDADVSSGSECLVYAAGDEFAAIREALTEAGLAD